MSGLADTWQMLEGEKEDKGKADLGAKFRVFGM